MVDPAFYFELAACKKILFPLHCIEVGQEIPKDARGFLALLLTSSEAFSSKLDSPFCSCLDHLTALQQEIAQAIRGKPAFSTTIHHYTFTCQKNLVRF
jgi:hypothetical protein